jgi:outer membrane protein assembly factor BamB
MHHSTLRHHCRAGLVILAAALVVSAPAHGSSVALQQDPAHDGRASGVSMPTTPTLGWTRTFSGGVSYPLIVNGSVYVTAAATGSGTGTAIYALHASDGTTQWSAPLTGTFHWSALAYDAGQVFAINTNGLLTAFNASTGAVNWSVQLAGQTSFSAPPTATGGLVYLGGAGSGGTLYAVSEANGATAWTKSVENGDDSSPAVAGGDVVVTYPGQYYAFAALTGTPQWHINTGTEGGGGSTPAIADGHVFIRDWTTSPTTLIAALADGQQGTTFNAGPIPAIGGNVAYAMNAGTLTGRAGDGTGAVLWSFAGDGTLKSAPLLLDDAVIVGGTSGNVYGVDPATGAALWHVTVAAAVNAPDEQNVSAPISGLGASDGMLVVPAGSTVTAFLATPGNLTAPTVTGPTTVGHDLTADPGTWSLAPSDYGYQWQRCDASGGSCSDIAGETNTTYTSGNADVGSTLRVGVTATNDLGDSSVAYSAPTGVITAPPPPPTTTTTATTPPPPPSTTTTTTPTQPTTTTQPTTPSQPTTSTTVPSSPPQPPTSHGPKIPIAPVITPATQSQLVHVLRKGFPVGVHCFAGCTISAKLSNRRHTLATKTGALRAAGRVKIKLHLHNVPRTLHRLTLDVTVTEHGRPSPTTMRVVYKIVHIIV